MPTWANYHVLETDYENYAYVLSKATSMIPALRHEWVWVLTRKPLSVSSDEFKEVEANAKAFLEARIPNFKFDETTMKQTLQTEADLGPICTYEMK